MRGEPEQIQERKDNESLLEYFLSESSQSESASDKQWRTAWRSYTDWLQKNSLDLGKVRKQEVENYKKHLENELNARTPATYFHRVKKIIGWLTNTEEASHNPFERVDSPRRPKDTSKLEVKIDELREAVLEARSESIELFVFIVIALKTGLRIGEIVNLDLRDINLDHPISKAMPDPRREVYNHSDTLYVDSSVTADEIHNGEERADSNKKNSFREIPIDEELKSVLVWWIAMLPPTESSAKPLMRRIRDPDGKRHASKAIQARITDWTRRNDLNSEDMKHFGVDAHWCRHWFSTKMRASIDDDEVTMGSAKGYVEGLRGDSENSTIDTYTQEWKEVRDEDDKEYREVFEDNVPKLFAGEVQREL
jgi:site-specific recombinase XerC